MDPGMPDRRTVMAALTLAGRAPSRRNTQPWRWRVTDRGVDLHLDSQWSPIATDPESRDAMLACGIALHHLTVAFAAAGWATVVRRRPDDARPDLLASLRWIPHRATMLETSLREAITERRSDHRPYQSLPIPAGYLSLFRERAAALGGIVRLVSDSDRACLAAYEGSSRSKMACASGSALAPPSELRTLGDGLIGSTPRWSPSETGSADGAVVDHAELFVAGTPTDDPLSRVRAGEAISAVLLTATNIGLATCLLTRQLESRRDFFRTEALGGTAFPQALLRVGWAPGTGAVPTMTPRRPVEDLMLDLSD
ncbi:NAD(P)H nitroreductase [Nocardia neocaledoniensis]|uniref:NAD(P)H nitroreductase n=1 Tax=Nocardia neocaledoniensis TaxID=236511 RepID=UPI00245481B2|nr:NAD(P)H nitroreductase [Nocardia neocaledoniensis]